MQFKPYFDIFGFVPVFALAMNIYRPISELVDLHLPYNKSRPYRVNNDGELG